MTPAAPDRFNLADYFLFERLVEGLGSKDAVRFGARAFTYGQVAQRARAFAGLLQDEGIRRGERVLLVLPDVATFTWVFFGVLARGAVVAMANPDATPASIAHLIDYTRATAIVTVPRVAAALAPHLAKAGAGSEVRRVWCVADAPALTGNEDPEADCDVGGGVFRALARDLAGARDDAPRVETHRDEPAIWLFTSGSTGAPRANVHAHGDFAFSTEHYAKATIGFARADVTLSVPRLYFGYATGTNLMFPFAVGATVALFPEKPTAESLARAIALYRPTVLTNVPTMLAKLLEHDQTQRDAGHRGLDLTSVRFSLSAGEALAASLRVRWRRRFGSDVYDGIGSAEMFHIYASNRPGDVKPGSLGRAVEGYELRVLPEDAEGPAAPALAPGEIGVLWVKGESVSQGYWLDREKTERVFHGPWCRTGDLVRIDEDGYLFFVGRADHLFKVSGQWVAPAEVEHCLSAHDAVLSAAVVRVGRDGDDDVDRGGGNGSGRLAAKAYVTLRAGAAPSPRLAEELRAFVGARLPRHKVPRVVEFVDELPRNDRGKIDRKQLDGPQGPS